VTLHVEDLAHRREAAAASSFEGVGFRVRAGELLLLAGPSGSGKTTLLRTLAGLERSTGGRVRVNDRDFVPGDAHALGLVFQTHELFPNLSVLVNCTLGLTVGRRVDAAHAEATARTCLDELGVGDLAERYPDRLSHGQRQRVAIARALALAPAVLLLDEPSASLDPLARRDLAEVLRRLKARSIAVVVVSHDFALLDVADRLGVLAAGRLVEEGPTASVLANPHHDVTRALLEASRRVR